MNSLNLSAKITQIELLRYTPSGLPALNLILEHESQIMEAQQMRQVKAQLKAVALGVLAERLAKQSIGIEALFKGFVSSPKKSLLFHIQEFEAINLS